NFSLMPQNLKNRKALVQQKGFTLFHSTIYTASWIGAGPTGHAVPRWSAPGGRILRLVQLEFRLQADGRTSREGPPEGGTPTSIAPGGAVRSARACPFTRPALVRPSSPLWAPAKLLGRPGFDFRDESDSQNSDPVAAVGKPS